MTVTNGDNGRSKITTKCKKCGFKYWLPFKEGTKVNQAWDCPNCFEHNIVLDFPDKKINNCPEEKPMDKNKFGRIGDFNKIARRRKEKENGRHHGDHEKRVGEPDGGKRRVTEKGGGAGQEDRAN